MTISAIYHSPLPAAISKMPLASPLTLSLVYSLCNLTWCRGNGPSCLGGFPQITRFLKGRHYYSLGICRKNLCQARYHFPAAIEYMTKYFFLFSHRPLRRFVADLVDRLTLCGWLDLNERWYSFLVPKVAYFSAQCLLKLFSQLFLVPKKQFFSTWRLIYLGLFICSLFKVQTLILQTPIGEFSWIQCRYSPPHLHTFSLSIVINTNMADYDFDCGP
jgi:hypothetical protein